MKKANKYISIGAIVAVVAMYSCVNDLDVTPIDPDVTTSATVYNSHESYKQVLAKLYGGLSLTGQKGPDGDPDILGLDEGASNYIRAYWYLQELPTEMALWIWNDPGLPELQTNTWSSSNEVVLGMYSRLYYQIALANEFIRESAGSKLSERGLSATQKTEVEMFAAEARFLRALSYYHALDLFGSVPFVTENDGVGAYLPKQISKPDLFSYIETELKDIENKLAEPLQNEYARVDKAAAWLLLARLYLNAEVYTGQKMYTQAITYSKLAINSGYQLDSTYANLFLADNYLAKGIILPAVADGLKAQTWGGITMIACSAWSKDMGAADYGIDGWGGNRARKQLIDKFTDPTGATDKRAMFYNTGHTVTTDEITEFTNGYAVVKYKNITSQGILGSNNKHMDIDFPLLRVADAYLIFAEAVLRGGDGATRDEALTFVNKLRERAFGNNSGNINDAGLTLDFLLDERAREFYWEGYRRTDLVRFGKFTSGQYLWEWKGGIYQGMELPAHLNHYPIPASDITANPNLKQDGY